VSREVERQKSIGLEGWEIDERIYRPPKSVAFRIFYEQNLNGWRQMQPPLWSVMKGHLHVDQGPVQLETKGLDDDLMLQPGVRVNSGERNFHSNCGVFLRDTAGGYGFGYEIQIRNEFQDGDRAKPVDIGTGGLCFHQPARSLTLRTSESVR